MKKQTKKLASIIFGMLVFAALGFYLINMEGQKNSGMFKEDAKYQIIGKSVNYHKNAGGYLAKPLKNGDYPGVIMIHEWWGLNDNIKEMADNLAGQGYVVLAVDLYNGEVADDANRARELSANIRQNPQEAIENMKSAISYLKENYQTENIASLGWCFGGQQSLQISLNSDDINATVIYYGNLVTDKNQLSKINHPVLGIFGSEDTSIPVSTVEEFEKSLNELEIENEIKIYDGVGHAFANPSGANYAPEETKDAWAKTLAFLERNLK